MYACARTITLPRVDTTPDVTLLHPENVTDPLGLVVVPPQQKHVVVVELHAGGLGMRVHPSANIPCDTGRKNEVGYRAQGTTFYLGSRGVNAILGHAHNIYVYIYSRNWP